MALSFEGVFADAEGDCLDAAIGAAVGVSDSCIGTAGGCVLIEVAFCRVFARWTLFWGRGVLHLPRRISRSILIAVSSSIGGCFGYCLMALPTRCAALRILSADVSVGVVIA